MFTKTFNLVEKWFNDLSMVVVIALMLIICANVAGRYVFNAPFETTLEFTEFFMVAIVYLGISYTQFLKAHMFIDILVQRFSKRSRALTDLISYTASFALFALIVWHGTRMFIDSWEMREITMGTIELPVYPSKLLVPLGSLFMCIRLLIDIVECVKTLRRK